MGVERGSVTSFPRRSCTISAARIGSDHDAGTTHAAAHQSRRLCWHASWQQLSIAVLPHLFYVRVILISSGRLLDNICQTMVSDSAAEARQLLHLFAGGYASLTTLFVAALRAACLLRAYAFSRALKLACKRPRIALYPY